MSYRKTGIVPPALLSKPDVTPDMHFYLDAFNLLSGFRGSSGFGANPLSYGSVADFAEKVGYNQPGDYFFFLDMMSALDSEFLRIIAERKPKPAVSKNKPNQKIWTPPARPQR